MKQAQAAELASLKEEITFLMQKGGQRPLPSPSGGQGVGARDPSNLDASVDQHQADLARLNYESKEQKDFNPELQQIQQATSNTENTEKDLTVDNRE
ncbi:unnamed protein product [Protopolystoma xenopodis]|uniref:Uncharacterized protein n=1 Tax=Protopolystoma xenopodis TaxID=117903 RepID=A0A448X3W4_9PLAT|nr:unnamed protein product [Protopolystoma xenopodis]